MRKLILLLLLPAFVPCLAQNMEVVMERSWYGITNYQSDPNAKVEYTIHMSMKNVQYDIEANTFSCIVYSSLLIDGLSYSTSAHFAGSIERSDYSVQLIYKYKMNEMELPLGYSWVYDNFKGNIYSDSDHEGHYLIDGTQGGMKFQFSDAGPY